MGTKPLREEMPEVARFVDALRDAFGRDSIDPSLSRGLGGEPLFFAAEAGRRIGTALAAAETGQIWHAVRVRDRYYCEGCDGSCVGTEQRCAR
jgi:hypothetical protein